MNPRFYHEYSIAMELEEEWIPEAGRMRYRCHALDADNEVVLGAQSYQGYGEAMRLLGEFLDGELARRGVPEDA